MQLVNIITDTVPVPGTVQVTNAYVYKNDCRSISTVCIDYVYRITRQIGLMLKRPDLMPVIGKKGTESAFKQYKRALSACQEAYNKTGQQCEANLNPQLLPYLGHRVEVTLSDGSTERFYVGKSTGWIPCLLRIARCNSRGGDLISYSERFVRIKSLGQRH